ncbi:TonB-dependent receptor [Aquimarina litoralis]|uniref:TonB-dependent receptor n=1 Tax=Aquimarina litoralis TaxID=584605 RepID=UPI001C574E36|nr:TonB-dependent receptor plug domain-containing protein [Aquimarina litoralis]
MRGLRLTLFLFFFWYNHICSQDVVVVTTSERPSLVDVLNAFIDQHQFSFSYDVKAIEHITLKLPNTDISFEVLQKIITLQTPFLLQRVSKTDYILVKNTERVTICGVIIDAFSEFELPQADILQNKKTIGLTNNNGSFELQLHPWDSISISYFGYQNKTIKVSEFSSSKCDTINLRPEIQNLGQVLVKEYLTQGIQKNQDASVNISTKKLRILPGLAEPDVLQSLQLIPGITSPTEDPASLYIRGGTPGQNLVLWDGIRMFQNGHFFNQISSFNPFITESIQVYRSGTSVKYGDNLSGVINIESDNDLTDKLQTGSGLNLTHGDLFIKLPLSKKLGILLAGRRSTTDIYQNIAFNNLVRKVFQNTRADIPEPNSQITAEERLRQDDFSFSDSNFKLLWKPNKNNTIKFSTIFTENRLDNKITTQLQEASGLSDVQDILKIINWGFSINWDKKYTNNISQNVNLYGLSYDQRYGFVNIPENDDDPFIDEIRIDTRNEVSDIGFRYALHVPIQKKHAIDVGYQFSRLFTRYERFNRIEPAIGDFSVFGEGSNHIIYSQYSYKTAKSFINVGIRRLLPTYFGYSYISSNYFVEPRLFASHKFSDTFTLNGSAELKTQQINSFNTNGSTNNSLPSLPVADNIWILSFMNSDQDAQIPFIEIVESRQFTLGGLYTYNGWHFDLEGYYKKITNLSSLGNLIFNFAVEDNIENAFLIGEEERIGFDLLIKKKYRNYRLWAGYSLSKTISSFPVIQNTFFPGNFDQRHTFNISQTLQLNNFEFALGWNYATGRPFTKIFSDVNDVDGAVIDPRGINTSRFPDYHRLDASATYRFLLDRDKDWSGMIGLSIRNIYNRKNIISQGFRGIVDENFDRSIESFDNQSLRFTPNITLRFNF